MGGGDSDPLSCIQSQVSVLLLKLLPASIPSPVDPVAVWVLDNWYREANARGARKPGNYKGAAKNTLLTKWKTMVKNINNEGNYLDLSYRIIVHGTGMDIHVHYTITVQCT